MQANPKNLTDAQVIARTEVFKQAAALANDLRDATAKAVIEGQLPLKGLTAAVITNTFGTVSSGRAAMQAV